MKILQNRVKVYTMLKMKIKRKKLLVVVGVLCD